MDEDQRVSVIFSEEGPGYSRLKIFSPDTPSNGNKAIVKIDEKFYRPAEVDLLIGDPSLAKTKLGWKNKMSFENLVQMMVEYDMNN